MITSHGSDVPGFNPDRFILLHRFTPPLLRRILRQAAGPDRAVGGPAAPHRAAICRLYPTAHPDREWYRAGRFTSQRKESRILVATRLFERKGVQHVIEALAATPDHQHELEVAGDGPQRAALERQARDRGVPARFHGWLPREALDRLYERSRIFVLASMSDNFPVSLLEAMAAGCAVITTRAGGCPEVVGDAGLVVEPGDVQGLQEAMTRLIRQPAFAEELGGRAAKRVRELFGWPAIVSQHEAVYDKALRRSPASIDEPASIP